MFTTTRQTKQATMERTIDLTIHDGQVAAVVMEHAMLKTKCNLTTKTYWLRRIASDFGQGYEVEKIIGGEVYQLHASNGTMTCDCPGGSYRGQCRHAELVKEANRQGLL